MDAVDAEAAKKAEEAAKNINTNNTKTLPDVYEDENGELVVFDD